VLQPGDVIIGLDNETVETTADLTSQLKTQAPQAAVRLQIEREDRVVDVDTPLMPPAEPGQPPRIGIMIEDAGFDVELPFPVEIVPQKIVGGPSAGLMFTLTVYNLLTLEDLTGGRTIAGTGTINLDGTVGPIGGVQQKVAGEDAQAVARRISVVEVATAQEAIQFLLSLTPEK
jgi:PDZ domain-containing protein